MTTDAASPVSWREAMRCSLRRELAFLAKSRWDIALMSWMPLAAFTLIWAIFSAGQLRDLPIAVIDRDNSAASRELRRLVDAGPSVQITGWPINHAAAMDAMRMRQYYGVLEIPEDFGRKLARGETPDVPFFYNAQFSTAGATVARDVQAAIGTFAAGARGLGRVAHGENPAAVGATLPRIDTQMLMAFNEASDYRVFLAADLVPSLLAILMTVVGASAIGREVRDRSLGTWIDGCGGRHAAALVGKLLPAFVVFAFWGIGFLAVFGAAVGGWTLASIAMLCGGMLVMVCAHLLIGATFGAISANLPSALSLVGIYTAPAFAYSGQTFPMLAMPAVGKFWAMLLPLAWWLEMQGQQALADAPASASARTLFVLVGFLAFAALGSVFGLRRIHRLPERWGQR